MSSDINKIAESNQSVDDSGWGLLKISPNSQTTQVSPRPYALDTTTHVLPQEGTMVEWWRLCHIRHTYHDAHLHAFWYVIRVRKQRYSRINVPIFDVSSIMFTSHASNVRVTEASFIYSMWSSGATRGHRSGPTLAQVMACCLTASNCFLKQCWLLIG